MSEDESIVLDLKPKNHWLVINTGELYEKLAEITDHTGTCEITAKDLKNIVEGLRKLAGDQYNS